MFSLVVHLKINLLNIILALSPVIIGVIGVTFVVGVGGLIWFFLKKSQLSALHHKAIDVLHNLQSSLSGLNEALEYLNKYPEIVHIDDNIHASDISQVISEYLHFTDANILGDKSINKKPMKKAEAQEFIDRVTNSIKVIEPIKKNNVALVEGIKTLEILEEKKLSYEQRLPDFEQRIQAIDVVNTNWWHQNSSFTKFDDMSQLQVQIVAGIAQGWKFLQGDGSTQNEAQGIDQLNNQATTLSAKLDQMAQDLEQLEKNIQAYEIRLPKDLEEISAMNVEIDQWQAQYAYVRKVSERQRVIDNTQQTRELAEADKKDWGAIIHHLDIALNTQTDTRNYFVKFDKARLNYEDNLRQVTPQLAQIIDGWLRHPDYANLPSFAEFNQDLTIAQNSLNALLAKSPEIDWLATEEITIAVIKDQEALIEEFEEYKVAHQTFIKLDAEVLHLSQEVAKLEDVIVLHSHHLLVEIDQKERAVDNANNWFDRVTTTEAFLKVLERYANDLQHRQEKLNDLQVESDQMLEQAKTLLGDNFLPDHNREIIYQFKTPTFVGREYNDAINLLENALQRIKTVYEDGNNQINAARQRIQDLDERQLLCSNAIENALSMKDNTQVNDAINEAISALEVPVVDGLSYDEAMETLELMTAQANNLYNQAQEMTNQQPG